MKINHEETKNTKFILPLFALFVSSWLILEETKNTKFILAFFALFVSSWLILEERCERSAGCNGESAARRGGKNTFVGRAQPRRGEEALCRIPQRHVRADGRRDGRAGGALPCALLHAGRRRRGF